MDNRLWYKNPASQWVEALPVGNGRLGAMVYGGIPHEEIQLNEETVWEGAYIDRLNPRAAEALPEIRRLLFEGKELEASALTEEAYLSRPPRVGPYQPLASLRLELINQWPTEYERSLELATGIARVTSTTGKRTIVEEVFASAVDHVVIARIEGNGGTFDLRARLDRAQDVTESRATADGLRLAGRLGENGVSFRAQAAVRTEGGRIEARGNGLVIHDAESVTFVIAGATSYVTPTDQSADPEQRCAAVLQAASSLDYQELRARHIGEHQPMFDRVSLDLGTSPAKERPTDERLGAMHEATGRPHGEVIRPLEIKPLDPELYALTFSYCRYLLLADSRPGCKPGNLQGLWNDKLKPPWECDYHANINLQMHYWPAEVTALGECHTALVDWLESIRSSGEETARKLYNCRGWTLHHVSDVFANTAPIGGLCGVWPVGGAWLCAHLWEHYRFTEDETFLRDRAWPLMQGAARFLLDFLVEAPAGTAVPGALVTAPSHSPENTFRKADGTVSWLTYAATMDNQIIRELLSRTAAAMRILGIEDAAFQADIDDALARLPKDRISEKDGRLLEWIEEYEEPEPGHRHISHAYAMFPSDLIDVDETPELATALRRSIDYRLANEYHATGWSLPWLACLFARFGDGEKAWQMLTYRLGGFSMPNLFSNAHGQPQVGDALGFAAAVAEMLLQSHNGTIRLLPALPSAWPTGSVRGLRARGAFEVDISWKGGNLTEAVVRSQRGTHCRLRGTFEVEGARAAVAHGYTEFDTEPGKAYRVTTSR
ncbi:MAG: glycosyl hydrolase family 95 catalytic domain-containing protein [Spirochaetales bacterium]